MGHKICFRDVETQWYNALPLGNGKFGVMVYFQGNCLRIAMNHYDCYYRVLPQYASRSGEGNGTVFADPARRETSFEEIKKRVDKARAGKDYEYSHYLRTMNPEKGNARPLYQGGSYSQGGEVRLFLSEEVNTDISLLELSVEEAVVRFSVGDRKKRAEAEIYVPSNYDGVVIHLSQSQKNLWKQGSLWYQDGRGQEKYIYEEERKEKIRLLRCRFQSDEFVQESALYMPGVSEASEDENVFSPELKFLFTASVQPGEKNGELCAKELWKHEESAKKVHTNTWKEFWKSTVCLPDNYLETLWHLYVYLLECCSGKDSLYMEQACGLSGLWDIRKPCMWGSMWYWDVNIQTAFYGTFSSNHVEQAKVFCDAFLSYREEAHKFAQRIYGKEGWALDYPHALYQCIQPWCALFLWKYYTYTQDREFLEKKAYPAFIEILRFYETITEADEKGIRHLEYDICPEQGPVGRDTVISTAAIKQLIQYALQGAEILDRENAEIHWLQELSEAIPEYAVTGDGSRWKDSELVQDNIFLRHPSVLMPIFPAEEVHMESMERQKCLAENTIRYAQENTEVGTFGFSWLASAAARMGEGGSALRMLYENGLDFLTHSNGLAYEETERFINYCHLTKPANYLPVMCETAGGVTAAVNLMLLQEIDGIIRVFPAVPDGTDTYAADKTQYKEDRECLTGRYPAWNDCEFYGLLAPGAFEISAQMRNGKTVWLKVVSKQGGKLRIYVPEELTAWNRLEPERAVLFEKDTAPGEEVIFGKQRKDKEPGKSCEMQMRKAARTHRRTFIGENKDTAFYKALDAMVCPYGYAESLHYPMTPYVFDFTDNPEKNYDSVYEPQIIEAGRAILNATAPRIIGTQKYNGNKGYGFTKGNMLCLQQRKGTDVMRMDFVEGTKEAEFGIELPAGKYDLLVVSGDEQEPSVTNLGILDRGIYLKGKKQSAGRYQYRKISVIHEQEGILKLTVDTVPGMKWKLNAIIVNKDYMFL